VREKIRVILSNNDGNKAKPSGFIETMSWKSKALIAALTEMTAIL